MLKLLVYGYAYGTRSSRKLEREVHYNVSFMWLMGGLRPDHKTIAEFRRQNREALRKVIRECARICWTCSLPPSAAQRREKLLLRKEDSFRYFFVWGNESLSDTFLREAIGRPASELMLRAVRMRLFNIVTDGKPTAAAAEASRRICREPSVGDSQPSAP